MLEITGVDHRNTAEDFPPSPTTYAEFVIARDSRRATKSRRRRTHSLLWEARSSNPSIEDDKNGETRFPHLERMAALKAAASTCPAFCDLSKEMICRLCEGMREKSYTPGETILHEREITAGCHIIMEGRVKLRMGRGRAFYKVKGQCFGEDALTSEVSLCPQTILAVSTVSCLYIKGKLYRILLQLIKSRQLENPLANIKPDNRYMISPLAFSVSDLKVIGALGQGSYGRVELVKETVSDLCRPRHYAMKSLHKNYVSRAKQVRHTKREKLVMSLLSSDFIVRCYGTLQDRYNVYFLLEPCLGGDLWTVLRDNGHLDEESTMFYTACVVEGLAYLHEKGVVFRDLKPENVVLDRQGYAKLTDFGFSQVIGVDPSSRTWTFCGTPQYIAPEVISNRGHDFAVDYWALGILIYELLEGIPPFDRGNSLGTYNHILQGFDCVSFSCETSQVAQSLIRQLCRSQPRERLGYNSSAGWQAVREHSWFFDFSWSALIDRIISPPYIPDVRSDEDMSNFDYVSLSDSDDSLSDPDEVDDPWVDF